MADKCYICETTDNLVKMEKYTVCKLCYEKLMKLVKPVLYGGKLL